MKYIPRATPVSALRFGKHIPPKWYMNLINQGKAFATIDNSDKTNPLKLEIQLPSGNVTAVPRRLDSIRPRRQNKRAFP